jgi:hypothetical protein
LNFGYDIEIDVIEGCIHDNIQNKGHYKKKGGNDENKQSMAEHFAVIFLEHFFLKSIVY